MTNTSFYASPFKPYRFPLECATQAVRPVFLVLEKKVETTIVMVSHCQVMMLDSPLVTTTT